MKTCTKCKKEKPANTEYFNREKAKKDGLNPWCKECRIEYDKQKRAKNKKKKFIYDDKKVKECNKCREEKPANIEYFYRDKSRKDGLTYTCKECVKKRTQKYYQENKEHYSEYRQKNKERYRETRRKYYQKNKEEILEYGRKHYQENKEYYIEYSKEYYQENKEWCRLNDQRRRARMAELPYTLTDEEWKEALEYFDYSCAYCGVPEDNLCQEHVIPVVKGGPYTQKNIIPACQSCNSSKHVADMEEWYPSYRHYSEEKLSKILDYVKIMEEI